MVALKIHWVLEWGKLGVVVGQLVTEAVVATVVFVVAIGGAGSDYGGLLKPHPGPYGPQSTTQGSSGIWPPGERFHTQQVLEGRAHLALPSRTCWV